MDTGQLVSWSAKKGKEKRERKRKMNEKFVKVEHAKKKGVGQAVRPLHFLHFLHIIQMCVCVGGDICLPLFCALHPFLLACSLLAQVYHHRCLLALRAADGDISRHNHVRLFLQKFIKGFLAR